ncbi:MAG: putative bifunctional diguanylate cyclase/phosphodiesterase [Gemmatimonadota bacterium]
MFGTLWVLFSDRVVQAVATSPYQIAVFQQFKGWIFVLISLVLIYVLVRGEWARRVRSDRKFAAAFATIPDPMAIIRLSDGAFVELNEDFIDQLGYSKSELEGRSPLQVGLWAHRGDAAKFAASLRETGAVENFESQFQAKDGSTHTVLISGRTIKIGRDDHVVFLAKNITDYKAFQARLTHEAFHDPLTDLPNRALLLDRLTQALALARRRQKEVAVLLLNVDRFNVINHSLGYGAGDELLVEIAHRITGCLRREDTIARAAGMVARISADEFTIVLGEISKVDDALGVVERIRRALDAPFTVNDHEVSITAGVGIAFSGETGSQPEVLLRAVGIATRRAKAKGLNRYHVFDRSVDSLESHRLRLENDLREAVGRGELELDFQPIIALATGTIAGFEALVRWRHPEFGLLLPMEFIPIAEESGLVLPIGRWVLQEGCRQGRRWHERFPDRPPLSVCVNISAEELRDPGFDEAVSMVLLETGLQHGCLQLEVTESLLLQSLTGIHKLKELDVKLAIDDFGTGYSSLNHLARLPVDAIKIDQSFIRELGRSPEVTKVVNAMVKMAKTLRLDVTAKGIETEEQLSEVRKLGCPYGQGFLFTQPLHSDEVDALLLENLSW